MTDEEKAEEYSDNLDLVKERNPELKTNDDFIKQAYLDGLAEGKKETCQKILNEVRKHEGIEQLTKFYIAEIIKNIGVVEI